MDTTISRSENTSADFAPVHDFNIAQAFPVTDALVRKVARARRRHQVEKIANSHSFRWAVAALVAITVAGLARKRAAAIA